MLQLYTSRKSECWDLYEREPGTDNFRKVGKIYRGTRIPDGMYHIAIEVIVTDQAGHMLVTRRSLQKKRNPGKYEFPAGSVLAGEDVLDAAKRELFEETGLVAQDYIKLHKSVIPGLIRISYLAFLPDLKQCQLRLQREETDDYQIVTFAQWEELCRKEIFIPSRRRAFGPKLIQYLRETVGEPPEETPAAEEDDLDFELDFENTTGIADFSAALVTGKTKGEAL